MKKIKLSDKLSSNYGYYDKKKITRNIIIAVVVVVVILVLFLIFKSVKDNSPIELTKSYLENYQELGKEVISNIKYSYKDKLSTKQEKSYIDAMKRQYEKLHFTIISEEVLDKTASIVAEVTIYDYNSCYNKANNYVLNYAYRFQSENKKVDYKLSQIAKCTDKVTYDIEFKYSKSGLGWQMESLSSDDLRKLDGTF